MSYIFKIICPTQEEWDIIESCYDSTVFKTRQWFEFLKTENCEPIVVEIKDDNILKGYFLGELVRRIIPIVGSPLKGFGTAHQGLSLLNVITPSERIDIYKALANWVFRNKIAKLIEIEDFQLSLNNLVCSGLEYEEKDISYIDLSQDEETLYSNLIQKSCRSKINKAIRGGVIIQETQRAPLEFLNIHFAQHKDVMNKHHLGEWESYENLKNLIECTYPDNVILLEALSPNGDCIASGIYPVGGKSSCSFSSASFQSALSLSPNELLRWEAIKKCKQRGALIFNNSGTSEFKLKFGSIRVVKPIILIPKYKIILKVRNLLRLLYRKTYSSFHSIWFFLKRKGTTQRVQ